MNNLPRKPLVSVITVCLNQKHLLKTCKSIVEQNFQNFEWIVIDGGSDDYYLKIFDQFKTRIDYFVSEPDRGIYHAMNKGITQAKGEYLIFLNAGDTFKSPDVLQNIFLSQQSNADLILGQVAFTLNGKTKFIQKPIQYHAASLLKNRPCHQGVLIKKTLFDQYGAYNEHYKIAADYDKWLEWIVKHQCSTAYINVIISNFDMEGVSSKNSLKLLEEDRKIISKYYTKDCVLKYLPSLNFSLEKKRYRLWNIIPILTIRITPNYKQYKLFNILTIMKKHHEIERLPNHLIKRHPALQFFEKNN